ncbi:hypothetical protein GCM10011316_23550 [Roseibium aquae]|uniref:DUF1491 family protein n=2 Tax=Roseibium aquae TaxID=1323746 RepID=A0A916TLF9_9HYPH|nr:DUF1491 family protein [Roseibium aquae]GGB50710.1 hypothetical protein GCM10011316_23550 [Roseibium aquae]
MRVTTDFFVSALVRRVFSKGGFAAVPRKGAAEAGAVFVVVDRLNGTYDLYGPAPQAFFDGPSGDRLFEILMETQERSDVFGRLEREQRMDPDLWIVEIEAASGDAGLSVISPDTPDA